jgi:hypothetical protein
VNKQLVSIVGDAKEFSSARPFVGTYYDLSIDLNNVISKLNVPIPFLKLIKFLSQK